MNFAFLLLFQSALPVGPPTALPIYTFGQLVAGISPPVFSNDALGPMETGIARPQVFPNGALDPMVTGIAPVGGGSYESD